MCLLSLSFSFFFSETELERQGHLAEIHPPKLRCLSSLSPLQAETEGSRERNILFSPQRLISDPCMGKVGRFGSEDGSY